MYIVVDLCHLFFDGNTYTPEGEAGGEKLNSFVVGLVRGPTSGAVEPK